MKILKGCDEINLKKKLDDVQWKQVTQDFTED